MENKKGVFATAGLVLAIISVSISWIDYINALSLWLGILAIVFGIMSSLPKLENKVLATIIISSFSIFATYIISMFGSPVDIFGIFVNNNEYMTTEEITKDTLKYVDVSIDAFSVKIAEDGTSKAKLVVNVTNKNDVPTWFEFTIEAVAQDGSRIDLDYIEVENLGVGQSQSFELFEWIEDEKLESMKSATFRIMQASYW